VILRERERERDKSVCTYVCVCLSVYVYVCLYVCIFMYVCVCVFVCVCPFMCAPRDALARMFFCGVYVVRAFVGVRVSICFPTRIHRSLASVTTKIATGT